MGGFWIEKKKKKKKNVNGQTSREGNPSSRFSLPTEKGPTL